MRSPALITAMLLAASPLAAQEAPFFTSELVFPLEHWHNHSSSVVELPGGDLLVAWFHGSGERQADDVEILGARWRRSTGTWTRPFPLADTPGFPDTNCVLYLDSKRRLWLLWPVIVANRWESALMKYRVSSDYAQADGTLHLTYSYSEGGLPRDPPRKSIKHAHFNVDWIRAGSR